MNTIIQSSLLQNYIANGACQSGVANNYAANNPAVSSGATLKNPNSDVYEGKSKKKTIAKAALLSSMALCLAIGTFAAFRQKGGILKTFKNKKDTIKEFFTKNSQAVKDKAENAGEFQKGADNITNAKDAITRHYLLKIPFYKRFDNFTTNIYKKTIKGTCQKTAAKAQTAFTSAEEKAQSLIKNGNLNDTDASRLKELLAKKRLSITEFAKPENIEKRFQNVDKRLHRLDKDVWDNIKDINKDNIKDTVGVYSKKSLAQKGVADAQQIQQKALRAYKNGGLTVDETKELENLIKQAANGDNSVLSALSKADKKFQKAYTKESVDLIEKLRDVNCGSAPTDIMSAGVTLGTLGIYTAQADTKEEKVSVSLTTGIPLAATLGTTLYATCKMVSGAKALLFGLFTGFAANQLGKIANKKYKEHTGNTEIPKTIVTIDDYKDIAINTTKDLQQKISPKKS